MREIIFRGKAKGRNDWVEGLLIKVGKYCRILEPDCESYGETYLDAELGTIDGQAEPVIPETVGQYTGFEDKNGKKIFEGDIIRRPTRRPGVPECAYLVVFHDGEFKMVEKYYVNYPEMSPKNIAYSGKKYVICSPNLLYKAEKYFEVIGNVYDNPELLEEKT